MNTQDIVAELRSQRARLDSAIAALEGSVGAVARRGRPAKAGNCRRVMSAAARKRISEAMKKRWAERQGRSASVAAKTSKRSGMSPAARRKLSALMKARWAERRKARAKSSNRLL